MAIKQKYVAPEDTEGKLYRVRDKAYEKNQTTYIVWGENLEHEAAVKLQERVTGSERSQTARVEEMTVPLRPGALDYRGRPIEPIEAVRSRVQGPANPDPVLESIRQKGMTAARGVATAAQERSTNLVSLPSHTPPAPPAMEVDLPELEVPEGIDGDIDELLGGTDA